MIWMVLLTIEVASWPFFSRKMTNRSRIGKKLFHSHNRKVRNELISFGFFRALHYKFAITGDRKKQFSFSF